MAEPKRVDIPGVGVVEFPETMSSDEINTEASRLYKEAQATKETPPSVAREAGIVARGAAPVASMTAAGALMGAPLGPAGVAGGALIGGLAIPAADALVALYNLASRKDVQLPSAAIEDLMTELGYPIAESRGERMLQAGGSAITGAGGGVQAARSASQVAAPVVARTAGEMMSKSMSAPVTRGVTEMLAQAPKTQVLTAAPAAATAQYVTEATNSPLAGLVSGVAVGGAPGVRPGRVEQGLVRTEIAQQAQDAYKTAQNAGLYFKPEFVGNILKKVKDRLSSSADEPLGYDPQLHPEIPVVLKRMEDDVAAGRFFSLQQIDNLRQIIKSPAENFNNPKQQRITSKIVGIFDDALANIEPNSTIAGDSKLATNAVESARKLYQTQKKMQTIEDMVSNASISSAGYSQSGMDNALRTQFASLAKNKKKMAQFNSQEQEQILNIAKGGGTAETMMRFVGKFAVRGPITGAVQAAVGGPTSIMAAETAKRAAEALRQQNVRKLMESISLGRTPQSRTFELLPPTALRGLLSSQYGTQE